MRDDNDFPSPRSTSGGIIRYGIATVFGLFVVGAFIWTLGLGGWFVTRPVNTAVGVVNRIMDPDAALENYRWFRDANNGILAQGANIKDAKANLAYAEQHAPDRVSARMTELTGAKQVCNGLVGQYNSRSERIDSRLFKDPNQFFTGLVDGEQATPLPAHYDYSVCE